MTAQNVWRDARLGLILGAAAGLTAVGLAATVSLTVAGAAVATAVAVAAAGWMFCGAHRWVLVFLATAVLLPPLPLPWGDAGPHPGLLIAALGLLAGLARLRAWEIRKRHATAALVVLAFVLLLSLPMAAIHSGLAVAAGSLARIGLFAISIYMFLYLADGPGRELQIDRIMRVLFWSGLCSAAFACLDFYFQFPAPARFAPQFVWLPGGVFRRAQGLFYEASTLGVYCAFLLVMLAAVAVARLGGALRLSMPLLLAGTVLLLSALVLSFSRAAMLSLAVSLVVMLWLERKHLGIARRLMRLGALLLAALAVGATALYWLLPEFAAAYVGRFWYSGVYLLESPNLILSRRLETWSLLLGYLREHPWTLITGIGYKTLPYTEALGEPVIADNMYLSLLVETGLLGLGALLWLHVAVLATTWRWLRDSQRAATWDTRRLLGLWLFSFWCGLALQMLSGDILTYWRVLPAFLAPLAAGVRDTDDASALS